MGAETRAQLQRSARALLTRDALVRGLRVEITAGGSSMWPLIRGGDRLVITPARAAELRLDDVAVVARHDWPLCAHRVIALHPLAFRGDNNSEIDLPVDAASVIGRVVVVRRRGRYADRDVHLDRPLGRALGRLCRWLASLGRLSRRWSPRPCGTGSR
jgi:hypothetical protein